MALLWRKRIHEMVPINSWSDRIAAAVVSHGGKITSLLVISWSSWGILMASCFQSVSIAVFALVILILTCES